MGCTKTDYCLIFSVVLLLLVSHTTVVIGQTVVSSTIVLIGATYNLTRQGNVLISLNGGTYGAVCDSGWTLADATVVCRQLGFDVTSTGSVTVQTNSAFGQTSVSPVITSVSCIGNEVNLAHCSYTLVTSSLCTNSRYAGVTCFGTYTNSTSTGSTTLVGCSNSSNMQLVNGTATTNGRLQVSQNGLTWGTVCSQGFTLIDAQVVCGSLCSGVSSYAQALPGSYYGQSSTLRIVLTNVSCVGTESSILSCPSNPFNSSTTCTDAVGINCAAQYSSTPNATLTCGPTSVQISFSMNVNPLISNITPFNTSQCQNSTSFSFIAASPSYTYTVSYSDCGTTYSTVYGTNGLPSAYLYNGSIYITTQSGSVVTRSSVYQMIWQCSVPRITTATNNFQTTTVVLPPQQSNYSVSVQATINFYADPGYSILLQPPVMVQLNTPVYVQVSISQSAAALGYRVLVPTCVTSPFSNFSAPLYYLMQNNCVNDSSTILFTSSSSQLISFVFYSYRFVGNYTSVYMQCTTLLCAQSDSSGLCSGQCGATSTVGRRKRDIAGGIPAILINGPLYSSVLATNFYQGNTPPPSTINVDSPIIARAAVDNVADQSTASSLSASSTSFSVSTSVSTAASAPVSTSVSTTASAPVSTSVSTAASAPVSTSVSTPVSTAHGNYSLILFPLERSAAGAIGHFSLLAMALIIRIALPML